MRSILSALALLVLLTGCGKNASEQPKGEAKGMVTFQGQPVTEGTVSFFNSQQGIEFEVPIQSDGSFVIKSHEGSGLPVGEYVVAVRPPLGELSSQPGDKSAPIETFKDAPNIPMKYRQSNTTPLKVTIQTGDNEVKVEMEP